MKAIVCKEFGPPSSLVYEDVELPELKKSQIQIDVHSAGAVSYTHLTLPTTPYV